MIRVPEVGAESGASLEHDGARRSKPRSKASNLGSFKRLGTEIVGPAVGRELTSKGIWATVLSLAGILAYIAFRFQLSFAVGAVVATLHDLLVTFAFLAFFGYDLTLNVIAALLTITGFSTNDTIVIFDRVRENLRGMRRDASTTSSTWRSTRRWAGRSSPPARRCCRRWRCSSSAAMCCTASRSRWWSASSRARTRRCSLRPPS